MKNLFEDDTRYSSGYSDGAFRAITPGLAERDVLSALGPPLGETWICERSEQDPDVVMFDANGRVWYVNRSERLQAVALTGTSKENVRTRLGEPTSRAFNYTRDGHGGSYRVRSIQLKGQTGLERNCGPSRSGCETVGVVVPLRSGESVWRRPTQIQDRARRLAGSARSRTSRHASRVPSQRGPAAGNGFARHQRYHSAVQR